MAGEDIERRLAAIEYKIEAHFEHLYDGLRKAGLRD